MTFVALVGFPDDSALPDVRDAVGTEEGDTFADVPSIAKTGRIDRSVTDGKPHFSATGITVVLHPGCGDSDRGNANNLGRIGARVYTPTVEWQSGHSTSEVEAWLDGGSWPQEDNSFSDDDFAALFGGDTPAEESEPEPAPSGPDEIPDPFGVPVGFDSAPQDRTPNPEPVPEPPTPQSEPEPATPEPEPEPRRDPEPEPSQETKESEPKRFHDTDRPATPIPESGWPGESKDDSQWDESPSTLGSSIPAPLAPPPSSRSSSPRPAPPAPEPSRQPEWPPLESPASRRPEPSREPERDGSRNRPDLREKNDYNDRDDRYNRDARSHSRRDDYGRDRDRYDDPRDDNGRGRDYDEPRLRRDRYPDEDRYRDDRRHPDNDRDDRRGSFIQDPDTSLAPMDSKELAREQEMYQAMVRYTDGAASSIEQITGRTNAKVVMITGASGGVGKTTLSWHMANILSAVHNSARKRSRNADDEPTVWLVESDYQNPKFEERLKEHITDHAIVGTSEVVLAREVSQRNPAHAEQIMASAIEQSAITIPNTGLKVIPSTYDTTVRNPRMVSIAISNIVKYIARKGDIVFVDAPTISSNDDNLNMKLMQAATSIILVGNPADGIGDIHRSAKAITAPMGAGGNGVNPVNLRVFLNKTSLEEYEDIIDEGLLGAFEPCGHLNTYAEWVNNWAGRHEELISASAWMQAKKNIAFALNDIVMDPLLDAWFNAGGARKKPPRGHSWLFGLRRRLK